MLSVVRVYGQWKTSSPELLSIAEDGTNFVFAGREVDLRFIAIGKNRLAFGGAEFGGLAF